MVGNARSGHITVNTMLIDPDTGEEAVPEETDAETESEGETEAS